MRTKVLVLTALLVTVIAVPQWLSQTRSFLYSPNMAVIAPVEARHISPRMNRLSPNRYYKSTRIRVTGSGFGVRNSRNLFRLIKSGRAYPITVRSWSNTAVEGTLPNVANGRYNLQLQVLSNGHHTATSQVIEIISRLRLKNPSLIRNKPRLGKTPRLRQPSLTRCPDPAITRIYAINHSPGTRGTRNLRIVVILKNVGNSRYKSRPSQQKLIIKRGSHKLVVRNWPVRGGEVLMNPGAQYSIRAYFFRNWNPNPGEFRSNFSAQLVYGPDIRRDGNPENDDCRNNNNRKTITDAQIKRQLGL